MRSEASRLALPPAKVAKVASVLCRRMGKASGRSVMVTWSRAGGGDEDGAAGGGGEQTDTQDRSLIGAACSISDCKTCDHSASIGAALPVFRLRLVLQRLARRKERPSDRQGGQHQPANSYRMYCTGRMQNNNERGRGRERTLSERPVEGKIELHDHEGARSTTTNTANLYSNEANSLNRVYLRSTEAEDAKSVYGLRYLGAKESEGEADQSCAGTELEDTAASEPPGREAAFILRVVAPSTSPAIYYHATLCLTVSTDSSFHREIPSGCVLPCRKEQ